MKKFEININSELQNIEVTVKNGAQFSRSAIKGEYKIFKIEVSPEDLKEIKRYAIKNADDKNSNQGKWYAHCNGYSMDLFVDYKGVVIVNTYRQYAREKK